jgi:hypothetical protein
MVLQECEDCMNSHRFNQTCLFIQILNQGFCQKHGVMTNKEWLKENSKGEKVINNGRR